MITSTRLRALQRRRNNLINRAPVSAQVHLSGIDASQLRQAIDETIEPVGLFVNDFEHLLASFVVQLRSFVALAGI